MRRKHGLIIVIFRSHRQHHKSKNDYTMYFQQPGLRTKHCYDDTAEISKSVCNQLGISPVKQDPYSRTSYDIA